MKVLAVTNMWPSPERPHWGVFVRSQMESLRAQGVDWSVYEIQGWRSTGAYVKALREIPGVARRSGADLVHAHYGLSAASALGVRLPLVASFCGDDLLGRPDRQGRLSWKSRALIPLSRLAARRADGVIVKSQEMRRVIADVPEVEVIPNGVDLERFRPVPRDEARAALGWNRQGFVLLFAANPAEPCKNHPLAVEVERRLQSRGLPVRLECMYGRPPELVAGAMSAADVLLLPSFHEGSPNVVKEAMACGLPVVAAPVGDCEERLRGCEPSAVAERDPAAFTEATARVLAAAARSNGRELVAPLAAARVAERVAALYRRAVERYAGRRRGRGRDGDDAGTGRRGRDGNGVSSAATEAR